VPHDFSAAAELLVTVTERSLRYL